MRPNLTYLELFAGAGGLSRGLEEAGWHCVAHAEIEPHARAVLRQHWPTTPLHGDVTTVDWTPYRGVTLVSGGSPCQDLSVAGKRAGLDGARSGLFHELIRAWEDTRAPYCLWENVDGARSSNGGADFAAVLSAFVGATVPVPADGWRSSGVAAGSTGVAAWRVLDLQHFGPPQRRRRVFVVAARTGGCDPAEVLALAEGLCRHPSPREQSRQRTASGIGTGAPRSSEVAAFDSYNQSFSHVTATLSHGESGRPIAFHHTQDPISDDVAPAIGGSSDGTDTVGALSARADSSPCVDRGQPAVLAFTTGNIVRGEGPRPAYEMVPTLGASTLGDQAPHVLAFHHTQDPISDDVAPAIGGSSDGMGVVANTICGREHKGWNPARDVGNGAVQHGRPRRLTPKECERLMAWPDDWTRWGIKEDGSRYELSDTARYRLCGNGVGSPCVTWIATNLLNAIHTLS